FELAARLVNILPGDLDHVFFTNSGSESVDTALKIALAYWRVKGEGQRTRLIGREKGYHGVGFGGISVGGMVNNRKFFGTLLAGADHLPHTLNLEKMAFSRGQPAWGAHLADELENIVALHDASTIAAVIVEPVQGSAGVVVPPKGYLERLRQICDKHGILLIFDEVITGFGRLGSSFAAEHFGVLPDLMTVAKGITNATVPMGAVFVRKHIHDAFMRGPEHMIELFHGYTYSGHPLAAAAGMATLDVYQEEGLFARARELSPYFEDGLHSLRGTRNVLDVRNLGLMGNVELEPIKSKPWTRGYDVFMRCYENGVLVRYSGENISMSPPLIVSKGQIDQIVDTLGSAIKEAA
ncbi:MAG: aminotransferase class III-fold pyridoxal phosphate-dependent enzyme, partial [Alphaproteobacteria bacterium]